MKKHKATRKTVKKPVKILAIKKIEKKAVPSRNFIIFCPDEMYSDKREEMGGNFVQKMGIHITFYPNSLKKAVKSHINQTVIEY